MKYICGIDHVDDDHDDDDDDGDIDDVGGARCNS